MRVTSGFCCHQRLRLRHHADRGPWVVGLSIIERAYSTAWHTGKLVIMVPVLIASHCSYHQGPSHVSCSSAHLSAPSRRDIAVRTVASPLNPQGFPCVPQSPHSLGRLRIFEQDRVALCHRISQRGCLSALGYVSSRPQLLRSRSPAATAWTPHAGSPGLRPLPSSFPAAPLQLRAPGCPWFARSNVASASLSPTPFKVESIS